jgi:hypothetical protein
MEHWWNETDCRKLKYLQKNMALSILSTTHSTWMDLVLNLDLHGKRLVTCTLSHGAAHLRNMYIYRVPCATNPPAGGH